MRTFAALIVSSVLLVACGSEVGPTESNEPTDQKAESTEPKEQEAKEKAPSIAPAGNVSPQAKNPCLKGTRMNPDCF